MQSLRRVGPGAAVISCVLLAGAVYVLLCSDFKFPYPLKSVELTFELPSALHQSWSRPDLPDYCVPDSPADYWSSKYTEENLEMSKGYTGSAQRFRRVVEKAARGEPIKMGVVGGSVSSGRNVQPDETYHARIFQQWNTTFFPHPFNTRIDGARPATDSKYYSMCFREHVPDDVDLVFVELGINDLRTIALAVTYETLIRAILELPQKPAVIVTNIFALAFAQGIGLGSDVHLGVAQYYDVPVISLRNPLLPYLFADPGLERELFSIPNGKLDRRHMNSLGHEMTADFTTYWMKENICKVLARKDVPPRIGIVDPRPHWWSDPNVQLDDVPRLRMTGPWLYVNETQPILNPSCRSTTSTPRLEPSISTGWFFEKAPGDKFYWSSETPGAQITFDIETVVGTVGMFYLRSPKQGLGITHCWVDDARYGGIADGYWDKDVSTSQYAEIARDLPPGKHVLTCEILDATKDPAGGHAFKILGLAMV